MAKAAWSFVSVLGTGAAMDVAIFLGLAEASAKPPTWDSLIIKRMQEQEAMGRGGNQITGTSGASSNGDLQDLKKALHSVVSLGGILPPGLENASSAAMLTFAKTWKPARQGPGPGCVKVDGLIQVSGKKAYMAVYVVGWYDPKQKKFVDIQTQLKHILPFQQYPANR